MSPAIPPSVEVRRTVAAIFGKCGRHFRYFEVVQNGFDHHFGGKFHTWTFQIDQEHAFAVEAAQPAMKIFDVGFEEQAPDKRQNRIAQITVQKRHSALSYAPLETVAHDQIIPRPQFFYVGHQVGKVVAVV